MLHGEAWQEGSLPSCASVAPSSAICRDSVSLSVTTLGIVRCAVIVREEVTLIVQPDHTPRWGTALGSRGSHPAKFHSKELRVLAFMGVAIHVLSARGGLARAGVHPGSTVPCHAPFLSSLVSF